MIRTLPYTTKTGKRYVRFVFTPEAMTNEKLVGEHRGAMHVRYSFSIVSKKGRARLVLSAHPLEHVAGHIQKITPQGKTTGRCNVFCDEPFILKKKGRFVPFGSTGRRWIWEPAQ